MARVLVVDDDPQLLQLLEMMLKRAGHEPILADHGQTGIDLAIENPPDIAIIDVMMPDISGHSVCQRLRQHQATVNIPILILSARAQAVDRQAALEAGGTDFMSKPVSPKELAEKIDELLEFETKKHHCRVITIFSLRGGVGVSTLATNLAGALRTPQTPNVTLIDLSPNSGHIALQLRTRPQHSWLQLLNQKDPTPSAIRSLLISHPSGINLLAAPTTPTYNDYLSEPQIETIIETLRGRAEFVVIDAPPTLTPMGIGALKVADLIAVVMTADIASIQTTSATLKVLVDLGISGQKVHLLLNNPSNQQGLSKSMVERALRRPVSFVIAFDAAQTRALARGTPLALENANSPLPAAMQRMANAIKKAA